MELVKWVKPSFSVIGREGSTKSGAGFVQALWAQANARFAEIKHLAKTDEAGAFAGFWGSMTDFSRAFKPWQNGYTEGLYLAGAECLDTAMPPEGWTKWTVPGFEFVVHPMNAPDAFQTGMTILAEHNLSLAAAAQDYTDPKDGKAYICFPIRIF